MDLFELARTELLRSHESQRHPFLYFSLATFGHYPEARTVVNRKVSRELDILFFTDSRSQKVAQIRKNPRVTALFYHPKKKLQVRVRGVANFIDKGDKGYYQLLERIKKAGNAKDYTTLQAPGSTVEEESDIAFGNEIYFLAIRIKPDDIDVLQLGKEQHNRRCYTLKKGQWEEAVLTP